MARTIWLRLSSRPSCSAAHCMSHSSAGTAHSAASGQHHHHPCQQTATYTAVQTAAAQRAAASMRSALGDERAMINEALANRDTHDAKAMALSDDMKNLAVKMIEKINEQQRAYYWQNSNHRRMTDTPVQVAVDDSSFRRLVLLGIVSEAEHPVAIRNLAKHDPEVRESLDKKAKLQ